MWALGIIKVKIKTNRCARVSDAVVVFQIHLLIFDAAPQPLDEHVVPPSPFAVHADCNAVVGEHAGEGPRFVAGTAGLAPIADELLTCARLSQSSRVSYANARQVLPSKRPC